MFLVSKYAIPHLIEAGGGSIVNISSGGSIFGVPGISVYSAGKGGINALTRVMAVEYAQYGIRCNTIIVGRVVAYADDMGPEMTKVLTRVGNPRTSATPRSGSPPTSPSGSPAPRSPPTAARPSTTPSCSPSPSRVLKIGS